MVTGTMVFMPMVTVGVNTQVPNLGMSWSHFCRLMLPSICLTRPKPAFGRQGLDWDRWARIQFSQGNFGAKTSHNQQGDPTDLLWSKNVTVTNTGPKPTSFGPKTLPLLTRGPNRPFRCFDMTIILPVMTLLVVLVELLIP